MIQRLLKFFVPETEVKLLGRWGLKSCEDLKSAINSTYQNRDHCGDTICKTPKKAQEYIKVLKESNSEQNK